MKLFAWLWSLLPDKCEVRHMHTYFSCCRKGVRGNENLIMWPDLKVRVTCDYCTSQLRRIEQTQ